MRALDVGLTGPAGTGVQAWLPAAVWLLREWGQVCSRVEPVQVWPAPEPDEIPAAPLVPVEQALPGGQPRGWAPEPVSQLAAVWEQDESQPCGMEALNAPRDELRLPDERLWRDDWIRDVPRWPVVIPGLV